MVKKDLFANSSSSNDDDDQEDEELAQQMVTAAMRERRRDPHAYAPFSGKKKMSFVGTAPQKARSDSESTDSSGSGDGDTWKEEQRPMFQADVESMRKIKKTKRNGINNTTADGDDGGIRINQQYAAKYEEVKRRKEIQQLTEKYGKRLRLNGGEEDEDEDEEDEEDDEAVLLTEEKELAFARAFLAIRQSAVKQAGKQKHGDDEKNEIDASSTHGDGNRNAEDGTDDPLGPQNVFFPPTEEQIRENTEIFTRSIAKKRQQRKKFTLADEYRRGVVTGVETHASGHESNDDDEGRHQPQGNRRIQPRTAKERALRESFLKSVAESTETFDVQLVDAAMQTGEREAEHTNSSKARRLLQGAFSIREADKSDPANEDPDEAFLREFFVEELWKPENNKKRKQKVLNRGNYENGSHAEAEAEAEEEEEEEEEEGNNYAALAELAQAEEDERFYAEAELWERAYQDRAYRHQEEEADHVQTFPRAIGEHAAGIMRKSVKSSRKDARMRRLERIKELREQQVAELRRLKTLKRQEIESQRALIASVAGIRGNQGSDICNKKEKKKLRGNEDQDEEAAMARLRELWSEKDLEEEFDPQKFDKKMAQIFDDAYYDENNVDEEEMAFFEEGEEEVGTMKDGDDDDDGRGKDDAGGERSGEEEEEEAEPEWYKAKSLEEAVAMTRKKTLNGKPNKHDGIHVVDDALALLYPSVSLQAAETASFSGRREHIEHMIRENKKKKGEKGHEADGKKEETLRQLREDLERKEKEYWQLHHDSTLDQGAIKTRFKYRQVAPEDFTLTVEEILSRDDRQLNMLVPMSCYAAYLQEDANRRDRLKIERRRQRGFREVDPTRSSRRYGDVSKTALVDVNMTEEEGEKWSKEVRGGLRRLRESVTLEEGADMTGVDGSGRGKGATTSQKAPPPPQQQQQGRTHHSKKARYEREEGGGQTRQYLHYQQQQQQQQHTQEREGMRRGGGRGRATKGGGALHIARGNGGPVRMRERN